MTELDKLYEEIEQLLEGTQAEKGAGAGAHLSDEDLVKIGNDQGWTYKGKGKDNKILFTKPKEDGSGEEWGFYNSNGRVQPYGNKMPSRLLKPYVPMETQNEVQPGQPPAQETQSAEQSAPTADAGTTTTEGTTVNRTPTGETTTPNNTVANGATSNDVATTANGVAADGTTTTTTNTPETEAVETLAEPVVESPNDDKTVADAGTTTTENPANTTVEQAAPTAEPAVSENTTETTDTTSDTSTAGAPTDVNGAETGLVPTKGSSIISQNQNSNEQTDNQELLGDTASESTEEISGVPAPIENESPIPQVQGNDWEDGTWKNTCTKGEDGYYYPKTQPNPDNGEIRVKAQEDDIKPAELQANPSENAASNFLDNNGNPLFKSGTWYLTKRYSNGAWSPVNPPQEVGSGLPATQEQGLPAEQDENSRDVVDAEYEVIPDEAATALNKNTQLNYRLKSVIDSPDIQNQIDASPNGINYVGIDGDKISLVTMGESKDSPVKIPSFIRKFMEAKEVEISSLGAGGQTNLNVFLTPEIQEYLKSKKGNPNITKVMLGKDGMVWLMDDKNNPYLLDDMKVNDEVATKDQEGNSFNVFINNGGANGGNGNGANGQGTGNQASDGSSNGNEPYGEITQQTTISELNAIKGKLNERLSGVKDKIESSLSDVNTSLKEVGLQAGLKDIRLSSPVKGTYLQDKQPKSFTIKEAKEGEEKDKSEEKETKEPAQTTTGDTEVYVIEEFYIKPLEESTEEETPTEEVPNDGAQNGGEDLPSDIEESMENYFLNVLKEAQNLLIGEPENKEQAETPAEGETEQTETPTEGEPVEGEPAEEEEPEKTEEELAKEKAEKEEKIKQLKNQSIVNILRVSTSKVVEALNGNNGITLSTKTDDKTTFTGRKTEDVVFTFGPGDESKSGFKVLDQEQGLYKGWFTFVIAKSNSKETAMTKLNRFMNRAVGVADVMNKLAGGTTKAAEV